jgi:hypothetical protein
VSELQNHVSAASDEVGLHAGAPTLLLELQTLLGALTASAAIATDRGRRPFRVGPEWDRTLSELAFAVYNLADQTGVDLDAGVRSIADDVAGSRGHAGPS